MAEGGALVELFGHHHANFVFEQLAVLLGLRYYRCGSYRANARIEPFKCALLIACYFSWRPTTVPDICKPILSSKCKNLVGMTCSDQLNNTHHAELCGKC